MGASSPAHSLPPASFYSSAEWGGNPSSASQETVLIGPWKAADAINKIVITVIVFPVESYREHPLL